MKLLIALAFLAVASALPQLQFMRPLHIPVEEMEALRNLGFDAFKVVDPAATVEITDPKVVVGFVPTRTQAVPTAEIVPSAVKVVEDYENVEIKAPVHADMAAVKFIELQSDNTVDEETPVNAVKIVESANNVVVSSTKAADMETPVDAVKIVESPNDIIIPLTKAASEETPVDAVKIVESANNNVIPLTKAAGEATPVDAVKIVESANDIIIPLTKAAGEETPVDAVKIVESPNDIIIPLTEAADEETPVDAVQFIPLTAGEETPVDAVRLVNHPAVEISVDRVVEEKTPFAAQEFEIPVDAVKIVEVADNTIKPLSKQTAAEKVVIVDSVPEYKFYPSKRFPNPWVR